MDYGIKVARRGFDVTNDKTPRGQISLNNASLPYLLYALALPYLLGAKKQLKRYQIAASTLGIKGKTIPSIYTCLHETSMLFEDLATLSKYAERCNYTHRLHSLWVDIRNHIRHDIREEFDNESDTRKNARAQRLKLNPRLQTNIGFTDTDIKVGGVVVDIQEIKDYLIWAENIITNVLNEAKEEGFIRIE